MIEIIKVWLQRRRKKKQAAKEQQAAAELIEHIEQALNLELYEWQRLYIITGTNKTTIFYAGHGFPCLRRIFLSITVHTDWEH